MQNTTFKLKTIALATVVIGLSGCAATKQATEQLQTAKNSAAINFAGGKLKSAAVSDINDPNQLSNFGHNRKNWVNPTPLPKVVDITGRGRLPEMFKRSVSLTMPGRVSLVEVLSEIQRANNVSFDISQDVHNAVARGGQAKVLTPTGGLSAEAVGNPIFVNDFVYRGSLEGALDLLAAKANISWKWNGSQVNIFRFETRTYNIAALAGDLKTNSAVNMSGAPTSSGGGSNAGNSAANTTQEQGVTRSFSVAKWNEIKTYLLSMMSPSGTLATMESAGLVTVNDTPAVHAQLNKAVNDLNSIISQQIFVNVDVYAVTNSSGDNHGIDWNFAWGKASSTLGFGYSNSSATGSSSSSGNFNIGILSGPFQGSSVVLSALSTVGKASIVNQFALTTLNGEPTPVSANRKIGYIESIKSTPSTTAGIAPSVEVVQSAVFSGIGLTLTPKIQPDGKILMEYSMNLNDVEEIKNFTTGSGSASQTIQLPTTTVKNLSQRASLRSGQTLVLSGFKQTGAKNTNSGVGDPGNIFFGGRKIAENTEQYLVITITPYVAQNND